MTTWMSENWTCHKCGENIPAQHGHDCPVDAQAVTTIPCPRCEKLEGEVRELRLKLDLVRTERDAYSDQVIALQTALSAQEQEPTPKCGRCGDTGQELVDDGSLGPIGVRPCPDCQTHE